MNHSAVHFRLAQIAPGVLASGVEPELAAVLAHAATGCSPCARALLNARETAVEFAAAEAPPVSPREAVRARVLASARARAVSVTMGSPPNPAARPVTMGETPKPPARPVRFFDASGELARLHLGAPGDAERTVEVDALAAGQPPEGDACAQLLAQLEQSIGFPLLFVSVVRGARVGYRVQRGLEARSGDMSDRRRETTFCTHTVSGGGPLVVPNAAEEPFFRGSNMVTRMDVKAYVGVPLVTSRGITIGTICAMDYRPRVIRREVIRALELLTEPVLAEVERAHRPLSAQLLRSAAGAPIHRAPWFRSWLDVELGLARAAGRPSALLVVRAPRAEALADVARDHEAAGHLGPDVAALLLSGADARAASSRAAEVRDALGGTGQAVAVVPASDHASDHQGAASWIAAALAAGA